MQIDDVLASRYTIEAHLGAGGMGVVWRARDLERATDVALKTLRKADPASIYQLKQEFRALADLRHPNLVRYHDFVADGEHWFFTMEVVAGEVFTSALRPGMEECPCPEDLGDDSTQLLPGRIAAARRPPADLARLRRLFLQLADGIQALHAAGKVHRDLKPANVLVTAQDRVVILDFGIATELRPVDHARPAEPAIVGTPAYMAPEQADGEQAHSAIDCYAFGTLLFEALTGRLPFPGRSTPQEMLQRRAQLAPRASSVASGVPGDLDDLCVSLLATDPLERATMAEVFAVLEDTPESPRAFGPSGAPRDPSKFVGREQELAVLEKAHEHARSGIGVSLLIHGVAGVGKTALVRHFLEGQLARGPLVVLSGRCHEHETVPYKALDGVIDALSQYLDQLAPAEVQAVLPRDIRSLSRLFPVLDRLDAVASAPGCRHETDNREQLRRQAFGALRALLARIADRTPLVISIDDLQWGDAESAMLLADLVRAPDPPSLLLVGCHRSEHGKPSPLLAKLRELASGRSPVFVALSMELAVLSADGGAPLRRLRGEAEVLMQHLADGGLTALPGRVAGLWRTTDQYLECGFFGSRAARIREVLSPRRIRRWRTGQD